MNDCMITHRDNYYCFRCCSCSFSFQPQYQGHHSKWKFSKAKSTSTVFGQSECVAPSYRTHDSTSTASTVRDPTASYWPGSLYCRTWEHCLARTPNLVPCANVPVERAHTTPAAPEHTVSERDAEQYTQKQVILTYTTNVVFCLSNNPIAEPQR